MIDDNINRAFSDKVGPLLTPEARELWQPIADSFVSGGPDDVKLYLDAARDQLENQVKNLLEQYKR